jgi:hypothetical protein
MTMLPFMIITIISIIITTLILMITTIAAAEAAAVATTTAATTTATATATATTSTTTITIMTAIIMCRGLGDYEAQVAGNESEGDVHAALGGRLRAPSVNATEQVQDISLSTYIRMSWLLVSPSVERRMRLRPALSWELVEVAAAPAPPLDLKLLLLVVLGAKGAGLPPSATVTLSGFASSFRSAYLAERFRFTWPVFAKAVLFL